MAENLFGIFTPNMIPLDANGQINETELRRYVSWLIDRGIHGLYPNGSTGEFTRFTADERRRIVQITCDEARGRVPILAGAAEANVRETIQACERYLEFGARAVAIVSPYYYRLSPGAVLAYFQEIAENSPIDITLYNIPMFASPIDVPTIQKLAELPRIIGIKDSSGDVAFMLRIMAAVEKHRPEFSFLTGWDPALVPMLAMGCNGGTLAMSGVVPEITRKLFDHTSAGQWKEARALQIRLTELFDLTVLGVNFPEGVRAAIEMRGLYFGNGRQPVDITQHLDHTKVEKTIAQLLSIV